MLDKYKVPWLKYFDKESTEASYGKFNKCFFELKSEPFKTLRKL